MAKFRFAPWLREWLVGLEGLSFEWDAGNVSKSQQKHGVTCEEAEEAFVGGQFIALGEQVQPPVNEPRYGVLGKTATGRLLFVAFTLRNLEIRVISARPANEKERRFYASLRQE
jgi:uncharacterized DUF497 family protein